MDYLETLSYNILQQWAKKFKIRANQKAAKLRSSLLEHVEEIKLELNVPSFHLPPPSSSTPTKSSSLRKKSELSPDNGPNITEEQAASISYRRNNFDDICVAGEKEFMKSFEANGSRLLESFNRSPQLVSNEEEEEKKSADLEEGNQKSPCAQPEGEKHLNATYDLSPCDDSVKENVKPDRLPSPPSPPRHAGNSSVIVIEEDSGFFIYENSEVQSPDKETKKVSIQAPKAEVKPRDPLPAANATAVKFSDAPKPAKKSDVTPKSAKKAPNFQLLHQRQFARMESIAEFQKRLQLSANKSKIPCIKPQVPFKTSSAVVPEKPGAASRVTKPFVAPKGLLTPRSANVKLAAAKRGAPPNYKAKRPLDAAAPAPPMKKLRLEAQNARRVAAWK